MLNHELRRDEGILVLKPERPLQASDFATVTGHVDAYLEQNGMLRGVMLQSAASFPGWQYFGALLAYVKLVKHLRGKIEKVAVVADGGAATVMPQIAGQFVHAQIRHFDLARESAAWDWLMEKDCSRTRKAA